MPKYGEKSFTSLKDSLYLYYDPDFLSNNEHKKYYEVLESKLKYASDEDTKIVLFGKKISIPRKCVAYGNCGLKYTFAGSDICVRDWNTPEKWEEDICNILKKIRDKVKYKSGILYNYVLINRYNDGDQYIGFHKDNEKEIRQEYGIACVSLGANRDIIFKPDKFIPTKKEYGSINLTLEGGSYIEMKYPTNLHWKHSIPKRTKINTPRISLTFRKITRL